MVNDGSETPFLRLLADFHENTKLRPTPGGGYGWQMTAAEAFEPHEGLRQDTGLLHRVHDGAQPVSTITATAEWQVLSRALARRRSQRQFSNKTVTRAALADIIDTASGVTAVSGSHGKSLFSNPSAGNLRSAQSILVRNLDGRAEISIRAESTWFHVRHADLRVVNGALADPPRNWSAVVVIYSKLHLLLQKYGIRGYRYALLDAGHLMQNILVCASALEVAAFPSCGFFDNQLNSLLGLDGKKKAAMYVAFLGHGEPAEANTHISKLSSR